MSTVTVTTSADAAVNDGTAASLAITNTGSFSVFIKPWQRRMRPGERVEFTPEGQAVTARGDDGATTLDVTATAAPTPVSSGQPDDDDLTTIAALDSTGSGVLATDGAGWLLKTYAALKTALSLGNVNNTADTSKPVSTAQQTALDLKAPLASPTFTGTPAVPTASAGTNTTQAASTAFVRGEVSALVASSPSALDTLNELAGALGNDAAFSTTVTNSLAAKAPIASPTFTGTPAAPTATAGTNTTQLASTAFVTTAVAAVAVSRPSTQGSSRTGLWDPTLGLYNMKPTNTRKARAGIADAYGATGTFLIDCIGDSTTAGTGATAATSWPTDMRTKLGVATGLTVRPGMMLPGQSPSEWTPTLGAGWGFAAVGWANAASYAANSGSGNLRLSADNCIGFKTTYVTKGTFTVSIDSGGAATVTTNNADAIAVRTDTGLSPGTHTIDIAVTASTAYIVGIEPIYAAGTIAVSNFGIPSKTTADWSSTSVGYGSIGCIGSRTATRLTLINLGINDANGGPTTGQLITNLGTIITAVRTAGADPVLIVPTPPTGISGTWVNYCVAIYDAADAADCPLIDLTYRWTDHATSIAFKYDNFHPNALGYMDAAKAITTALTRLL